jgi:mono/diheme cytochrome c family protein
MKFGIWTRITNILLLYTLLLLAVINTTAIAASGEEILRQRCVSCHELDKGGPVNLKDLWSQKGPNLSYAGNKYQQQWLAQWLKKPTRIRPAGMYYGNHIKPGKEHDHIDTSTLSDHVKLAVDEATSVAGTLMKYRAKSELIEAGAYKPGKISLSMGDMMFVKFRGCSSCHRIEADYGGVSGPEVYTAAKRLQPDYIISFLKNPQAWSPKTYMPQYHLKEKDLQKFVHYFRALAGEDK